MPKKQFSSVPFLSSSANLFFTEPDLIELMSELCEPYQRHKTVKGLRLIVDGRVHWQVRWIDEERSWFYVIERVRVYQVAGCIIIMPE